MRWWEVLNSVSLIHNTNVKYWMSFWPSSLPQKLFRFKRGVGHVVDQTLYADSMYSSNEALKCTIDRVFTELGGDFLWKRANTKCDFWVIYTRLSLLARNYIRRKICGAFCKHPLINFLKKILTFIHHFSCVSYLTTMFSVYFYACFQFLPKFI